ncbi:MAG: hypothetical protein A2504_02710 [Bdellovibrionales bacterium RIFOXYD12_FULL_39_22]|nr:MAG: hypothetical protein A2385_12740 [Bdellovibrionales bacterium RIFOXYB1_FULL_39_21]OFZ41216.1 MAG: hypothetical protein A2485_01150 [Bdellovibrionales bacterium RIFOXYC12_FULL_39_17]OFZ44970.1 MAG: hypothetical protein A2404_11895 [Bdellovibrionales bacterium RIFOXYC1_FULL_39_130]OFZ74417.1 MAG: hypothetical protein A2560_12265 [Bdellovibrionales bacterium RIFOXYD1_FULL_39_84]OFZ77567.1 MAG: hypothetical protein A2451_11730 [Bdellovibrionales bacterium RIFOXYC2_FULL_39_8]OFZ92419.1 MAG:
MKNTDHLCALISLSAFASPEQDIARVRVAMKSIVGISRGAGDIRLNVYKVDGPVCGSAGNSIIADFGGCNRWRIVSNARQGELF